ncbi:uncharacterized protein C1orf131 homolog [Hypomesus transpacificus]|uniref:uncharacterized protein C1orf131 homolog n=1 Tax=Hypomesus transpacificus TaxID=137520 RepID=UPI001F072584|nr:uncharacterized protein C1orf131 homolog [Hypomesus transpacificus]
MNNENEEDLDQSYLDDVLNTLYDFGDGQITKTNHKNKSQKNKRKRSAEEGKEACADEDSLLEEAQHQDGSGTCSDVTKTESDNQHHPPGVEVVTFQDPMKKFMTKKSRVVPVASPEINEKSKTNEKQPELLEEFSLEKARLEVHRFGITGYKKEQQRMFEQERAIMLGAKPPKKEYVNYKLYQQMSKDKKQKAREEVQTDPKKKKKKSKPRDEKRKSSSGSSAPTGQVGRFKNGMLVLSSKEIQKIKTSRVIK